MGDVDGLHCARHILRFLGSLEGGVLDGVAVDFTDVEVLFYFGDVRGGDAVGCSPDFRGSRGVLIMQSELL